MQVFGLLGNPVGHSLSPSMHEAAYEARDLDARYVTFEPDPDDLGRAVDGAEALGVSGLNVTIPFKEDVLAFVEPDELAARILEEEHRIYPETVRKMLTEEFTLDGRRVRWKGATP